MSLTTLVSPQAGFGFCPCAVSLTFDPDHRTSTVRGVDRDGQRREESRAVDLDPRGAIDTVAQESGQAGATTGCRELEQIIAVVVADQLERQVGGLTNRGSGG
jgi:hypothetical protein